MSGSEQALWTWKQQGRLSIWRFEGVPRNFAGWHLHGDKAACDSVVGLIDLLLASAAPAHKKILLVLERPVLVNVPAKWNAAAELRLEFDPDAEADYWQMRHTDGRLTLAVGKNKLLTLQSGMAGIQKFRDDYAIGPEVNHRNKQGRDRWREECLWFWS